MGKVTKYLVGDFETTVYKGQTSTEVWAAACVELNTEDVLVFHSIDEQFQYLKSLGCNVVIYFHNLKFDGAFWLSYLLTKCNYTQAYTKLNDDGTSVEWLNDNRIPKNSVKYSISDKGQWYRILVRTENNTIEIRDSLKLLPFTVKRIGKGFKTKHQKLDMEYTGYRYAGCEITSEELAYIKNDVLVVKEALEFMFSSGHDKMTIGSCCLEEYKSINREYDSLFPNLYEISLPEHFGSPTAGDYIRRSYKGGWCYLAKGKECRVYTNGTTADVNSLYPSMMHSESGNRYPVGLPTFWTGNADLRLLKSTNKYYFIRVRTRFYLKPNKLPCIQIKGNFLYNGREWLETSDVYNKSTGNWSTMYRNDFGEICSTRVTLTLTCTDFELIKEHYDLVDFEVLDGCWFRTELGIFDDYIDKYKQIKMTSTGAMRELAKLFLNNLYGKMASTTSSSFKLAYVKSDNSIGFITVTENKKKPGYIAVGSAITSYARNFTIRAAQANYYGVHNRGFIYADTDSIHCDLDPTELRGISVSDNNFCCWKLEACWDTAYFTRQKTYIEHVIKENLKPIDSPYFNVKCAGMPDTCKKLFIESMGYDPNKKYADKYTETEMDVIKRNYNIEDFKIGLELPGKLMPKTIPGGVLLVETTYQMR